LPPQAQHSFEGTGGNKVAVTDTVAPATSPPLSPPPPSRRHLWRLLAAVLAGLALLISFPPYGQWWAAPVGVAVLGFTVRGRRRRAGFGLGFLAGLVFFAPLLRWTNLHTGLVPWLLLSLFEALFLGLMGAATAYLTPVLERWAWSVGPLTGALWTGQEALRDRLPFGGFPWGRLAFSQGGSPLLRLAALGGAPFLTFAVGCCGGLILLIGRRLRADVNSAARGAAGPAAVLAVIFAGAWLVPLDRPAGDTVTVAIVQGNVPRLGLDFNAQRRAVLDNHVSATLRLATQVAQHTAKHPDLVIWPENSSDIDPTRNPDAADVINEAAQAIKAPILVGAVIDPNDGTIENTALVWQPSGEITGRYVKRHPVPFGEYIPLRSIARKVSKDVDLVGTMRAGKAPGVLKVGPATVGDVICFEVAYDGIVRDTVDGGAQLLSVQTNNATFNAAEAAQQLAMVRERAVESGRDALMASTVGISAFVDASGHVDGATTFDTQAVVVRELHLSSDRTLAVRLGSLPEWVIATATIVALAGAAWLRRRPRPRAAVAPGAQDDDKETS
jgi:apolipoprotein N-acyltransferase